MIIETINTPRGFDQAIMAMRNPMNSWEKSDSYWRDECMNHYVIGEKDMELSIKLQNAGPEHCKHLRMIYVWADITAARYFWQEFDTYRNGVEKVSCSTMHKLMARPLTKDDFENDCMEPTYFRLVVDHLNSNMEAYHRCTDPDHKKEIWRRIIQELPQSYLQKRTVCMSYAALRNIVNQRKGHKLIEWEHFIRWCESLQNSWMIFD